MSLSSLDIAILATQIILMLLGISIIRNYLIRKFLPRVNDSRLDKTLIVVGIIGLALILISTMRLNKQIDALDYTVVARYNRLGLIGNVKPPLTETTDISRSLQEIVWLEGDKIKIKSCGPEAIQKLDEFIKTFPKFPLGYYFKAKCLQYNGDPSWRANAEKAVNILGLTTTLADHHSDHDAVLRELREILAK